MQERSEEQVIGRLFGLENDGLAAQRAELTGERFLSLIQDPDNGLGYVFQHGLDETEGAEETGGAEVRDRYSASDDDLQIEEEDSVGDQAE